MVAEITSKQDFQEKVLRAAGPVLVDFYATWCGPCRVIAPKVQEFSNTYSGVSFFKVDVDQLPDVAAEVGITAMPTFVLFKDGELIDTILGANPRALEAGIQKLVAA